MGESFLLYSEQWPAIALLSDAQRSALFQALFAMHGACDMPDMDVTTKAIFLLIKPRIEANREKYDQKCEQNRENGKKGGRPRKDENRTVFKESDETENNRTVFSENRKTLTDTDTDLDFKKTDANASSATAPPIAVQTQAKSPLKIQGKKKSISGKRAASFLRWWDVFDDKRGKAEAVDAWAAIPELTDSLVEKIIAAAGRYAGERPTMLAQGRTPKMAQGWIAGRRWEDEAQEPASGDIQQDPDYIAFKKAIGE